MNKIFIKTERDSVCMADDMDAPHPYDFAMPENVTLGEVFGHLANKNYLASVAGKNHSWEALINQKSLALFMGNSQHAEPSDLLLNKASKYTVGDVLSIYFKYNSASN